MAESNTAPMGTNGEAIPLPPADAFEPNGHEPTAYKASTMCNAIAQRDERIRHLERELAERKPRVKPDPELVAALEEAAKTRSTVALLPDGEPVFINYGDEPEDDSHLCCTACGGSGHIEDQQGIANRAEQRIAELERELEQARAAFIGSENARKDAERARGTAQSIDRNNKFHELLADYARAVCLKVSAKKEKQALIAYIDGRTAGTAERNA